MGQLVLCFLVLCGLALRYAPSHDLRQYVRHNRPVHDYHPLILFLLPLCLPLAGQSTPAPRWLAGKEYRARITRKWKEPPPGPEAPTEAEIDNAVVVAAQGKGPMPAQALERQKTADAGKLMTAAPVVEKRWGLLRAWSPCGPRYMLSPGRLALGLGSPRVSPRVFVLLGDSVFRFGWSCLHCVRCVVLE